MDDHPKEYQAEAEGPEIEPTEIATAEPVVDGPAATTGYWERAARPTVHRAAAPAPHWSLDTVNPDRRPTFVQSVEAPTPRRRKRLLIVAAATIVLATGAVGGVLASKKSGPPGAGMAPAAFVTSSTQTTLAQRTADITYSGSITADGQDVPLTGSGEVDFDTNSFSASLEESVPSGTIAVRALITSGQFYMGMTINGQDMSTLTGGAHWVSIELPDESSSIGLGVGNVDPIAQLKVLEQKGATVTSLGTREIEGVTVSGFAVTQSHQEMENVIQQEIQQNQIPAAEGQAMLQAPELLGTFTTDVWIDGSGLIRQENENIAGGSAGMTANAKVTFQNYGTPVAIAPPASSDVIPFTQFLQDLRAAGGTTQE